MEWRGQGRVERSIQRRVYEGDGRAEVERGDRGMQRGGLWGGSRRVTESSGGSGRGGMLSSLGEPW